MAGRCCWIKSAAGGPPPRSRVIIGQKWPFWPIMVKWALLGSFHLEILPQKVELDLGFLGCFLGGGPAPSYHLGSQHQGSIRSQRGGHFCRNQPRFGGFLTTS